MRFALALLEVLLFACPREFRRAYRNAMRADFYDIASEEYALHGSAGFAAYACSAYVDILASGARERSSMIWRDLVYALRSLRKTPFFTAIVITTLAVAIAANAAVFSILDGVLFKPLPYPDPASLVALYQSNERTQRAPFSYPNFVDLRALNRTFADMTVSTNDAATLTGHGEPRAMHGRNVSFSYFDVFGLQPERGRFFSVRDSRLGSARAVVLSDAVYRTTFAGDPKTVGSSVFLDGNAYTVIGIAPKAFRAPGDRNPDGDDFWTVIRPAKTDPESDRGSIFLAGYGRLRPGVTLEAARADVRTVMANLARQYNETNKHTGGYVLPLEESIVGPVRPLLFGVFAAVAGVLLVACANVANLLLSRAATRERELAVRYAIGASRARIIAQILTETLLFAAVGGIIGVALAAATVQEFIALRPPGIPRLENITFDASAAVFTFTVVVFCTIAAGLVPALTLSRVQLGDALKAAGRGGDRSRGARARAAFVIAEIAITLALVVASGLVVRSFIALTNTPLGLDPAGVMAVAVPSLPEKTYGKDSQLIAFQQRAVEREAAVPGVIDSAWAAQIPFSGAEYSVSFLIPERPLPSGDIRSAEFNIVSAGYFGVLNIPLERGRLFNDSDRIGTPPVLIVNAAFAHAYYGNVSPVGKRFKPEISTEHTPQQLWTIVGVAADVRNAHAQPAQPQMYFPNSQIAWGSGGGLLVRTRPGVDTGALGAVLPKVDPDLAAAAVTPLSDYLATDIALTRMSAIALGTLAAIALLLAIAGIYAVVSYGVAQRTHEFGIRKALGARGTHVLRDVLIRAARLATLGVLLGLVLAGFAARVVATQLYGVGLIDPLTYVAVVVVLFAAALIAALLPALRAMRVDPIVALRYE